jgi:hypothetical protein
MAHFHVFAALEAITSPDWRNVWPSAVHVRLSRNSALMVQAGMQTAEDVTAWLTDRWHQAAARAAKALLGVAGMTDAAPRMSGRGHDEEEDPHLVGVGLGILELAACAPTDTGANRLPPPQYRGTQDFMVATKNDLTARALLEPAWLEANSTAVAVGRQRVLADVQRISFAQHTVLRDDLASILFTKGTPADHPWQDGSEWRAVLARIGGSAAAVQPKFSSRR